MIKNPTLVPPGNFAYMQPETGVTRNGQSLSATIAMVQEHRISNNLPRHQIDEVTEDVQLQICQRSPDDYCYGHVSVVQSGDINRHQLLSGARAIFDVIKDRLMGVEPFVDQAEADRRAGICARCFLNDGKKGCSGCAFGERLREAIGLTIGSRSTWKDGMLQACRVCGCLNRVTVWFKREILDSVASEDQRAKYAAVPHCWRAEQ